MKNILMILADQHHAGLMGCAGHLQVKTPHLDRLASAGVRFSNAYTQNPICTPSRVSILSGQYCHNHGLYGLSGPVPGDLSNLFRHCKAAGYRTAGTGKLHLPIQPRNWIADDVDLFDDSYECPDGEIGKSAFLDHLEAAGLRELEDSSSGIFTPRTSTSRRPSTSNPITGHRISGGRGQGVAKSNGRTPQPANRTRTAHDARGAGRSPVSARWTT